MFAVLEGVEVTFTNGTIAQNDGGNYALNVYGTVNVECTMTKVGAAAPVFDIYGGTDATVNVLDGAVITSEADVFRHKKPASKASVYVSGGTIETTGTGNYGIFNASSYPGTDDVAVITGGTFLGKFEQTEKWGGMTLLGADAADARFDDTAIVTATARLATGYEFVDAGEGLWKVQAIPSFDVTFTVDEEEIPDSATNVLRDTVLTADMIPDVSSLEGAWDVNPVGAVITCETNFNFTTVKYVTITLPQELPDGVTGLVVSQSVDGVEWELVEGNQIVKDNQYVVVATGAEGYTIANPIKSGTADDDIEVTDTDFEGKITPPAADVAQIGGTKFKTLADAVAAAALAGEAVKIELLANVTEDVAISGVEGELDLGDFTLTGTISVTDSTLEISNGTVDYGTGTFTVNSGTVTLAEDATMTGAGSAEPINIKGGTFNIYGTIDDRHTGDSFVIVLKSGTTVNAYEGCSITGGSSVFKPKCEPGKAYVNIYGGTFTVNHPSDKNIYGVFYGTKDGDTTEITIAGGTFVVNGGGKCMFYDCSDMIILDADGEAGLDDTCTATFNINPLGGVTEVTEEKLCKTGYVVEQSEEDGLWRIVKYVPPVAKIGTAEYKSLADAVAAAALAGEAVKIELLANVTENVAISGVEGELDLGDFTLTSTISVTDSTLTISNGTIDYGTGTFTVNSGTVTLAEDATMTGAGNAEPINVKGGTFNIYGTINDCHTGDSFVIVLKSGATVNAYAGCSITGGSSVFKPKCEPGKAYVNIYGGTFTVNHPSDKNIYGVFYGTKDGDTTEITIAGGTFVVNGGGKCMFYDCSDMIILDADGEAGLDDTCTATFNINPLGGVTEVTEEKLCKSGYTVEQSAEDGLWRIVKEYTIALDDADDMTYTVNTAFPLALPTPAESGKGEFLGWTNATVTTPITQIAAKPDPLADLEFFAAYKAVGPDWPSDWPADVPPAMKEAFQTWAETYGVSTFEGAENAFLMNDDPKAGTATALEIKSIEVADGVATIKVAAGEKNLQNGINGKLFVSATDDLAGEWVTTEVKEPKSFENEGKTAVFEVEDAQFMKAKVDFKVEVPADKQ